MTRHALFADEFQAIPEEFAEIGSGEIADVDAHLDFLKIEAGAFASDVGILGAEIAAETDFSQTLAEGIVGHQVPDHRDANQGQDAGAGIGMVDGETIQNRVDGPELVRRGTAGFVVHVIRLDRFAESDGQLQHAIAGVPAAGPEDANSRRMIGGSGSERAVFGWADHGWCRIREKSTGDGKQNGGDA